MGLSRRQLLQGIGAAAVGSELGLMESQARMPTRQLGKMGWKASLLGCGTAEIPADEEAVRAINQLIDGGVNYLDTAPSYTGTRSERVLGQIVPARRKELFIATKTLARDEAGAYKEITESLERLRVKQIDLLQLHAINDFGTLDAVLTGAVRGLERARKDGLVRFIGITGHTRPEVILKALQNYAFDSILIPLSAMDANLHDFATEVVPLAVRQGISIVGMKSLKGVERARGSNFDPEPHLRYAMSLPVSTVVVGVRRESEVEQNLRLVKRFKQMSKTEMSELEESMKDEADSDKLWWKARTEASLSESYS